MTNKATATPLASLVGTTEIAAAFNCSTQTINGWSRAGRLPAPVRIGRKNYWHRSDIENLIGRPALAADQEGGAQ